MQLAMLIDGNWAQVVILALIILDVVCVIIELVLFATMCPCATYPEGDYSYSAYSTAYSAYNSYSGRRLVASSGEQCQKGEYEYSHEQHEWHVVLHWISVSILCIFGLQIVTLMALYRLAFFKNAFYVLDFVVIGGALFCEMTTYFAAGKLFIIILSWRMLRVVHGIMSSVELQAKAKEAKLEAERDKLQRELNASRRALAKSKVFYYSFTAKLQARGVEPADSGFFRTNGGFRTKEAVANSKAARAALTEMELKHLQQG